MIYGIGTDIVEIARIQKVCEGNNRFLKRYYTEREQEMICLRKQRGAACAAVNFAGKEAVAKALKTGICVKVRLEQIEILRGKAGEPYVVLYGETKIYAQECGVEKIHISLSDSSSVAIAYAVAEGKENTCQSDVRSHKDYESAQK